jgi:hypothetical protein
MTQATNNYDKLYENMKQRFTVTGEDAEYTIGEYMLKKADVKKADAALPVALRSSATNTERAVASIVTYVNDKLTIKQPPVQDKTIRAFPFRASASAFLSAAVACSFMLSVCIMGASALSGSVSARESSAPSDYNETEMAISAETADISFE